MRLKSRRNAIPNILACQQLSVIFVINERNIYFNTSKFAEFINDFLLHRVIFLSDGVMFLSTPI